MIEPIALGALPPSHRGVFCNRTLNLRAIRAVGYDMDYTLIHYKVMHWEQRAYLHLKQKLLAMGWPVADLEFRPDFVVRGLILDLALGNLLKANRFGYVKRAYHGTRSLAFESQREGYTNTLVDLSEPRFVFLNTLFSLSEACMYAQLVDLLDARKLPEVLGYAELYGRVRQSLDAAHMEGQLKAEIVAEPERYVDIDPEMPLTLLDQRQSGKRLLLITNSEWDYTRAMMAFAFDPYLPKGMTWRDLFELVIVSARKPEFFSTQSPLFQVVNEEGLLKPAPTGPTGSGFYLGGNASMVEKYLKLSGSEILYVGDHLYTDVRVSKDVRRWRTALILRELEQEIAAEVAFRPQQVELSELMAEKEQLEYAYSQCRLSLQRADRGYGPQPTQTAGELQAKLGRLRGRLVEIDERIGPLAKASGEIHNPIWGVLMRTGNDKSHLCRQVERYADIYTSRVSNFLYQTPFVYYRSPRGALPHDPECHPFGAFWEEPSV